MKAKEIMATLEAKYGHEKEYLQAVHEVLESVEDVYNQHPEFEKAGIIERIVEPDRIFTFRVTSSKMPLPLCQWAVARVARILIPVAVPPMRSCVSARLL